MKWLSDDWLLALPTLLLVLLIGAPVPTGASGPGTPRKATEVRIDNFSFDAQTVTVPAGTQVTWVNHDDVPHKIVSTDKKIVSPVLDTDGRYSYTFTTPGTYAYYCSIHPMMTGKVVVT